MAANTIPTVSTLPPAPTRADAPADFTTKADAFVASLPKLVTQVNLTVSGMNDQASYLDQLKTDVNGYKVAAAQSVTDAANQVTLATTQANNAKTYADNAKAFRDSAQAIAAGYGNQSGLPALAGHAGDFLGVSADEQTVGFFPGLQTGFQEFTSTGSFPRPMKAKWIYVELVGGGSSGSLYSSPGSTATRYAQGGLGGDFNSRLLRASDLDANTAVVVGTGGASVTRTVSSEIGIAGNAGNDSSFGSFVKALGGKAPSVNNQVATVRDGDLRGGISGVSNSPSTLVGSSIKGGGPGASSAIVTGTITNGVAGTSQDAGNGGAVTAAGVFPGGGGGSVSSVATSGTISSGAGAGGRVRIWWW